MMIKSKNTMIKNGTLFSLKKDKELFKSFTKTFSKTMTNFSKEIHIKNKDLSVNKNSTKNNYKKVIRPKTSRGVKYTIKSTVSQDIKTGNNTERMNTLQSIIRYPKPIKTSNYNNFVNNNISKTKDNTNTSITESNFLNYQLGNDNTFSKLPEISLHANVEQNEEKEYDIKNLYKNIRQFRALNSFENNEQSVYYVNTNEFDNKEKIHPIYIEKYNKNNKWYTYPYQNKKYNK